MRLSKDEIERLKESVNIADVARHLGMNPVMERVRCLFPERHSHGDRTPSMTLNTKNNTFKCWVCDDVFGDVISLVQMNKKCTFPEALEWLARFAGSKIKAPPKSYAQPLDPVEAPELGLGGNLKTQAAKPELNFNLRTQVLKVLIENSDDISGACSKYLGKRKIFKKTWDLMGLKQIGDYQKMSDLLKRRFTEQELQDSGLFNESGHLRFYRHLLLLPYYNSKGDPLYLQARAIEPEVQPKELSLKGRITIPYNSSALNQKPGVVYLCEGVIDTLTLIEKGFSAVGVPGAKNFKPEWAPGFKNKKVFLVFDSDEAGREGAIKTIQILKDAGIDADNLSLPEGMDINSWFGGS
jgi:DNA primase